ncbi:MAG: hypothetical protein BWZ02_00601 [Lentisphaerae bacterium ADurb.BinA184]|nr:MAG: hypothetical protein BWZ02_00601 [Lentisphaerae bacterium ADurb.BinA184]
MARIQARIQHQSGIPLGGIGTGTVEIRPDGYFHEWQIFNLGPWGGRLPDCCAGVQAPPMPPGALSFILRTRVGTQPPKVRRLGLRADQHNLYSFPWLKSVESIVFDGRFPLATLTYEDASLPVEVTARLFPPFVPHEARLSGTPGFYAVFAFRNRSSAPVEVSLAAFLDNPLAWGLPERALFNTVEREGDSTFLTYRTETAERGNPTVGSLGLSMGGDEVTCLAGEYADYHRGLTVIGWMDDGISSAYGITHESHLYGLRQTGRLSNATGARAPSTLLPATDAEVEALPATAKRRLLRTLMGYGFVRDLWARVQGVDAAVLAGDKGTTQFLKEIRLRLNRLAGKDRRGQGWGNGALCSTLTLAPLEEREVRVTVGWHFPLHFSRKGPVLGHRYEEWFADAAEVNRFLVRRGAEIERRTCGFADTLYNTSLDPVFADAWSAQLSTLTKCTWWTRRGDFGVWEGLGCCGFHTTDITYQGSFPILALFPELQQRQMEMGAGFQLPDGRVHHLFAPDFTEVDVRESDRVDMNQHFVMLVCRDYLWTGDRGYLRRLWPNVVRAMAYTESLDGDGDGLPDKDTRRNTYDAWNFYGTPSYIASLWLAALRFAIRAADDLGRRAEAARWRGILRRARASFDCRLWNGEYYSLWADPPRRDECCMTDQLSGEWFTHLVGLETGLPRERILDALRAVMRYNYREEDGLVNASYPPGRAQTFSTNQNLQAMAPWTGVEYAMASMLFDFGLAAEASAVVGNVAWRYDGAGRVWNHVECGDHYYRALSSWAVLLGASGFKLDTPRGRLTVTPRVPGHFRAPWFSPTGYGLLERDAGCLRITCIEGTLAFQTLETELGGRGAKLSVTRGGRRLAATCRHEPPRARLTFRHALTLRPREIVEVRCD